MSRVRSVFIAKVKSVGLFLVRGGKAFPLERPFRTCITVPFCHNPFFTWVVLRVACGYLGIFDSVMDLFCRKGFSEERLAFIQTKDTGFAIFIVPRTELVNHG